MNDTELTDAERDIMLTRCGCGHTINDHGSLGHCWACLDDEREDCPHDFEDLLCERVARIIAARVAAAHAELVAAIDNLPALTEGPLRAGTSLWPERDRDAYSLAIEEAQAALRAAVADPEPETTDG